MSTPATSDLDALVAYFRQPGLYTRLQTELEAAGLERLPLFQPQRDSLSPFLEEFVGQYEYLSLQVFPAYVESSKWYSEDFELFQPRLLVTARIYETLVDRLLALLYGNHI